MSSSEWKQLIDTSKSLKKSFSLQEYIDDGWEIYKDKTAPTWNVNINDDFTCVSNENDAADCYTGCNYTNYYDTCFGANKEERKLASEMQLWDCSDINDLDSCKPYSIGNYGCFGSCGSKYSESGEANCGTDTWFDNLGNLNPNAIELKDSMENNRGSQPFTKNYPKWQNYYSTQEKNVTIRGWGSVGSKGDARCSSSDCKENTSSLRVRPYQKQLECGTFCNINQSNVVNNQGAVRGNLVLSNTARCNFSGDRDDFMNQLQEQGLVEEYINLMGSENCDKDSNSKYTCDESVHLCIDDVSKDNCIKCGEKSKNTDGVILYDASSKPLTCCLEPSINVESSNNNLLTLTGTNYDPNNPKSSGFHVSYVCASDSCPPGSSNLEDLQLKCSSTKCINMTESDCGNCIYCIWDPTDGICNPQCPKPSTEGWGVNATRAPVTDSPVTGSPVTSSPNTTGAPVTSEPIGIELNFGEELGKIFGDIGEIGGIAVFSLIIILGIIIIILIIIGIRLLYSFYQKKNEN